MTSVEQYATHIFSYRFQGERWTFEIVAKDANEAQERLKALAWANYDGELIAILPNRLGPFARITTIIRNVAAKLFS